MSQRPIQNRIYLDNAATSWPKPDAVYEAVDHYQRHLGAPAGRSGYAEAVAVSQMVADVRLKMAHFVGLTDPSHLIFTANGTDSLNLAIHGFLRQGDHVVTTAVEHNSVLRPLKHLEATGRISVTVVPCNAAGIIYPADLLAAIRPRTTLIAMSHASNVTGAIQPIEEAGCIARNAGALFLCDAAQTLGHMKIDMLRSGIDLLASSGHKGLLGPLGTGVLAIRPGVADRLQSIRQGGTGTSSHRSEQPMSLPDKFESGNLNVPGILGLGAGLDFLNHRGIEAIEKHGREQTQRLLEGFQAITDLRVLGPQKACSRVPLVSIVVEGYDPQEIALSLDAAYRIQVRPGLHCAPVMHESLGTDKSGGTVRFSLGAFTTTEQIDATIEAVTEIVSSRISI